jgi:hypothetical protein
LYFGSVPNKLVNKNSIDIQYYFYRKQDRKNDFEMVLQVARAGEIRKKAI